MYHREHPPPHIHIEYGGLEAVVHIRTGKLEGRMSKPALRLVWIWIEVYEEELLANWERARNRQPLLPIEPLE
jgi:hypothetical protein